jgi:hypothetical protein
MTYKVQIDDTIRQATTDEIAAIETAQREAAAQLAAEQKTVKARESALAKLADLGLTETEISALVGK